MKIEFAPLSENDFEQMHRWLNLPHVVKWWNDPSSPSEVSTLYRDKMQSDVVFPYIVHFDDTPSGYIQSYHAHRVGNGWWPDTPPGVWGIDAFIGEPDLLEQGNGSAMIALFSDNLIARPDVAAVIADPHPGNARAIRAYEKAGFVADGPISTPDGAALLMVKRSPAA